MGRSAPIKLAAIDVDDTLLGQVMGDWMRREYSWAADLPRMTMPVMLVFGDADMYRPEHVVEFYTLLGGGQQDAGWQRETISKNRLAIIPDLTHYDIFTSPRLAENVRLFLEGHPKAESKGQRVSDERTRLCAADRRALARTASQDLPQSGRGYQMGIPHFDYHGEMMCVFAAATKHCSFTFLKQEIMKDPRLRANAGLPAAKRFLGRLTALSDLPADAELVAFIREAMVLNEQGVKLPDRESKKPKEVAMPAEFSKRLEASPAAKRVFEAKSQSFRKEYLVWIGDAKTDATRRKRIDEALEWIAQGKGRFWKYEKAR